VIDERLRHFDRIVFGVALAHHYHPGLAAIAYAGSTLMKRRMTAVNNVMLAVLLAGACGGTHTMSTNTSSASMITSNGEACRALGELVRVRGTVQREKLGDAINVGDLSVRCVDFRFPDAMVGQIATAEGTLEIAHDEPAITKDAGEISQGTEDGGSSFVIRACVAQ
jgi:hypothetical protein